ncbi:hypothetical protein DRO02_02700 [archaeon]|nr:MAG: hypothetical protein DRO02_02700 [archaeon]RLG65318.1 MAG: hypothetical protein DRO21_02235 [archaeon]HDM23861.1 DUF120 domain-containing protein [Candidatus Bathyarchaeota archaeon]
MKIYDRHWFALLALARAGALQGEIQLSTVTLAEMLNTSQQTASRYLTQLSKLGYIIRRMYKRGQYIRITKAGEEALLEVYRDLRAIFERPKIIEIEGEVFTGLGEGKYYLSIPYYVKQIVEKLGFEPYPGTLNIRIKDEKSLMNRLLMETFKPTAYIHGFSNGKRTYGSAKCYLAAVNSFEEAAVICIERTHYGKDVVEIIAPVCLREKLNLKDGDIVKVKIRTSIAP